MTHATALFQSQLRSAIQAAQAADQVPIHQAQPRPRPPAAAGPRRTVVRLWLPLTPLWLLLAPFALLAAPVLALIPATRRTPPFRTAFTLGAALFALSGTVVDVDTREALVRIRFF